MFIGDGAKLVRDAFELAKEKAPAIIFIDELDAIGTKRFDSDKSGDREVQRTMLELLNQLDGFSSDERIKVIAATNRIDILDPALLRSGRLDRKVEFPLPNEAGRAMILQIHSRRMTVASNVNYEELARSTDEMNGAQLKAVCVEAGMLALREGATELSHEHFVGGIAEVQAKKKVRHLEMTLLTFCLLTSQSGLSHDRTSSSCSHNTGNLYIACDTPTMKTVDKHCSEITPIFGQLEQEILQSLLSLFLPFNLLHETENEISSRRPC